MQVQLKLDTTNGFPQTPTIAYTGDAGYDLYVSRSAIVGKGLVKDIHTDISIRLPEGYFARIVGRSSTLRKRGLIVNEGIIDNGYTGELFVCVYNTGEDSVLVHPGERLAQLIIQPIVQVQFNLVDCLPETQRGENGFGSSGK